MFFGLVSLVSMLTQYITPLLYDDKFWGRLQKYLCLVKTQLVCCLSQSQSEFQYYMLVIIKDRFLIISDKRIWVDIPYTT